MPTQPNEGGRDLERRASDVLNPEKRTETAGRPATRRKVLSMVTGGIAATAVVGTAAASKRPTVYAGSDSCGVIDLAYPTRGPTVAVDIIGDGPEDSYTKTLEPGASDQVTVPAGEFYVHARPARANGGSSVRVEGQPVPVEECNDELSVYASHSCLREDYGKLNIENPHDTCVPVRWEAYRNGEWQDGGSNYVESDDDMDFPLDGRRFDEWYFWAHLPPSSGNCWDTEGDTILINDLPSPLHLKGEDCPSISRVEDG